jgi:hypothetical protein
MGGNILYRNRGILGHIPVLPGQSSLIAPYRLQPDVNTLALWNFTEGSGTKVRSSYGTGNRDLTLYGSPAWVNDPTLFGQTLSLDGTDDYGSVAGTFLYALTNITVEAIVKSSVASLSGQDPIYVEGTAANVRLRFGRANDKAMFGWLNSTASAWLDLSTTNNLASWTTWNYIAGTSASLARVLYVNGVSAGSDTAATACYSDSTTIYVGKYPEAGYFTTMQIAQIRISGIARSAAEILLNAKLMGLA